MKNIEKLNFLIKANIVMDNINAKEYERVGYEEAERDALTLDYTREEIKNILSNKNSDTDDVTIFQFGGYKIKLNFNINKQFVNFINAEINRLILKKDLNQEEYNFYLFNIYNKLFKYVKM